MSLLSRRRLGALGAFVLAALLAGCAVPVQKQVDLPPGFLAAAKAKGGRIGVVMAELPKPDTQFPGAYCLLCVGVANMAHSELNKEVQSFSTAELRPLPGDLVALLQKQGLDAVLINDVVNVKALPDLGAPDPVNKSRKSFAALKDKYKLDRLLLVNFSALGVWRSYSAYVPTDPPRAVLNGEASLIDLSTHGYQWYLPLALSRAAEGAWDEPPKFPGLTNAYFQVLETGMDVIKQPFTR
jgi:hypothetical protein